MDNTEILKPEFQELRDIPKKTTAKPTIKAELLQLLNAIEPVDFHDLADLQDNEKIKVSDYQVITVEQLLELAENQNLGLAKNNGFLFVYTGKSWAELNKDELTYFLGLAAERYGVPQRRAKHYKFRKEVFEQFMASSYFPQPERNNRTLVNFNNGTLEINPENGSTELKEHNRNDFLTYVLPFNYDPDATAPKWQSFLDEVLPETELQRLLAEVVAQSFIPNEILKTEKVGVLHGSGSNGKGVVFEVISKLLGKENIASYSLEALTDRNGYYRAMIANKLLNFASEINTNLEISTFKALASGEPIDARLPYGAPMQIENYARLIFSCNRLPSTTERTHAFFRRFIIIPFNVQIPDSKQDRKLSAKIINSELPGVLNWVLEGLQRLLSNEDFTYSETSKQALGDYKLESDSVAMFLTENEYIPSNEHWILLKNLYSDYKTFCAEDGFKAVGKPRFRKLLKEKNYLVERTRRGYEVHAYTTKSELA